MSVLRQRANHFRLLSNTKVLPQHCVLLFAPFEIPRQQCRIHCRVSEMSSIHGPAMQSTHRELDRAARGCPSITGSWPRPVAKNYRDFGTELDR
jgi:hypothetical protein